MQVVKMVGSRDGAIFSRSLILAQLGFGLAIFAALIAPPARGVMLLVPLTHTASAALPRLVFRGDTRLIGQGAIPGSLVVYGRRSDLALPLLTHAVLSLASPEILCGKTGAGA
jgi:hypothetical protein